MEHHENDNKAAGAPYALNVELERLRVAAGIELEYSYEAGSKWQVGDEELAEIVRLAKEVEREACASRADAELKRTCGRGLRDAVRDAIMKRSNISITGTP